MRILLSIYWHIGLFLKLPDELGEVSDEFLYLCHIGEEEGIDPVIVGRHFHATGNAVPVNMAWAIGRSLIRHLNQIEQSNDCIQSGYDFKQEQEYVAVQKLHGIFEGMVCDPNAEYDS